MPKDGQFFLGSRLKSFVSEFSASAFLTAGKFLYCKYSVIKVGSEKQFNVTLHINMENNKNSTNRKEKYQHLFESRKVQQMDCFLLSILFQHDVENYFLMLVHLWSFKRVPSIRILFHSIFTKSTDEFY